MIDFDKMTVAEHEQYKEMQRKAEGWNDVGKVLENTRTSRIEKYFKVVEIVNAYYERTD